MLKKKEKENSVKKVTRCPSFRSRVTESCEEISLIIAAVVRTDTSSSALPGEFEVFSQAFKDKRRIR